MSRENFIYELKNSVGMSYGETTDVYMLPVGTKFTVENGFWSGKIVEIEGSKYIEMNEHDDSEENKFIKLEEHVDYALVISIENTEERDTMGCKYRHYKGGVYEKLMEAAHTENKEMLVIYKDSNGNTWARPKEMFEDYLEYNGKPVKRFTLIK